MMLDIIFHKLLPHIGARIWLNCQCIYYAACTHLISIPIHFYTVKLLLYVSKRLQLGFWYLWGWLSRGWTLEVAVDFFLLQELPRLRPHSSGIHLVIDHPWLRERGCRRCVDHLNRRPQSSSDWALLASTLFCVHLVQGCANLHQATWGLSWNGSKDVSHLFRGCMLLCWHTRQQAPFCLQREGLIRWLLVQHLIGWWRLRRPVFGPQHFPPNVLLVGQKVRYDRPGLQPLDRVKSLHCRHRLNFLR